MGNKASAPGPAARSEPVQTAAGVSAAPTAPVPTPTATTPQSERTSSATTAQGLNSSSNTDEVTNEEILETMGFTGEDSSRALRESNNDIHAAVQKLTETREQEQHEEETERHLGFRFRNSMFDRLVYSVTALLLLDALTINQRMKGDRFFSLTLLAMGVMNGHSALTNQSSRGFFRYISVLALLLNFLFFAFMLANRVFNFTGDALRHELLLRSHLLPSDGKSLLLPMVLWQVSTMTLFSRRSSLKALRGMFLESGAGSASVRIFTYVFANSAILVTLVNREDMRAPAEVAKTVTLSVLYAFHTTFLILPTTPYIRYVLYSSVAFASYIILAKLELAPELEGWPLSFVQTNIYFLSSLLCLRFPHLIAPRNFLHPAAARKND